ncbi:hypothetical protein ACHAWX_002478 [Stephanocyclus meneghinianus]
MEPRFNDMEDKIYYPRTGKRGVPQQFPRKLYEMLEIETGSFSVGWTATGRGFQITNISFFSEIVLPKWFKTSKFSSFQRNLNLYGFTKNRKGVNTVYYHPKFAQGDVNGLSHIKKRDAINSKKAKPVCSALRHVESFTQRDEDKTHPTNGLGCSVAGSPTNRGGLDMLTHALMLVLEEENKDGRSMPRGNST